MSQCSSTDTIIDIQSLNTTTSQISTQQVKGLTISARSQLSLHDKTNAQNNLPSFIPPKPSTIDGQSPNWKMVNQVETRLN